MEKADSRSLSIGIDLLIRLGALATLIVCSYLVLRPFLIMIVWGIIIAIAGFPVFTAIRTRLHLSGGLAATVFAVLLLALVTVPVGLASHVMIDTSQTVATEIEEGEVKVPEPPRQVRKMPLVGDYVWKWWNRASDNIMHLVDPFEPQLKEWGTQLLKAAGNFSLAVLQFVFSILVAAVLLAREADGRELARRISHSLAGPGGADLMVLVANTIRSVTHGILAVAFIQAALAGIGLVAVGIPMAGLLTLICLLLCILQLGTLFVAVPAILYIFHTESLTVAILFAAYMSFVGLIDNILRPLLLGRGVRVPLLIVFIGSFGGLMAAGIIGLFVGAVILVLTYRLGMQWLKSSDQGGRIWLSPTATNADEP